MNGNANDDYHAYSCNKSVFSHLLRHQLKQQQQQPKTRMKRGAVKHLLPRYHRRQCKSTQRKEN